MESYQLLTLFLTAVLLVGGATEELAPQENVKNLKAGLAELYGENSFLEAQTMGDLVTKSLKMLENYPTRKRNGVHTKVLAG